MRTSWFIGAAAAAFLLTNSVYAADSSSTSVPGGNGSPATAQFAQPTSPGDNTFAGSAMGNDARQGRFYDENDQWLDPRSGLPQPGAPEMKDSGGGY